MGPAIERLDVSVYTVPTEGGPESDGTLTWNHTSVVLVEAAAEGATGLGFTYGPSTCGTLVGDLLLDAVIGLDGFDVPANFSGDPGTSGGDGGRTGHASIRVGRLPHQDRCFGRSHRVLHRRRGASKELRRR